jgi:predicted PurR-regulated permease PerM
MELVKMYTFNAMKTRYYLWRLAGIVLILLLAFVFFKIVIYILISSILFLIGAPVTKKLESIKIGNKRMPDALSATLTLTLIVMAVLLLFKMIVPPLIKQADLLSTLNFYDVLQNILAQFPELDNAVKSLGNANDLKLALSAQLDSFLNFSNISWAVDHLFSYTGTILGGTLCVLFITFFFLKDEKILKESILILTPSNQESAVNDILRTSKKMLSNYFTGLFVDMLIVGTLSGTLMWIMGIENALIIGFTAGLLNIVPYIGSVITMIVAVFLGVSGCIAHGEYILILGTITKIFFGLLSINLLDGFLLQPFIFSNSVKAHPLEIFIVTLMAATLGGIGGMIVALPVYTILRIVAKEFLSHYKFFRKLTEKIKD